MFDVCLVDMPFGAIERPSLPLGLLQAILEKADIRTTSFYANLFFAEEVGAVEYEFWEKVLGDLTFARIAFPDFDPDSATFIRHSYRNWAEATGIGVSETEDGFLKAVRELRERTADYIDRMADAVLNTGAPIVGCTSTYWQHTASLAILRRIRELAPSIVTMMGGANCETVMGRATHRNFPWVDYVVSGEADDLIVDLCRTALDKGRDVSPEELPFGVFGPIHRQIGYPSDVSGDGVPRVACHNLAELPTPNYDDYFKALHSSSISHQIHPGLLIETARGCWYGMAKQCKFCGISEIGMAYHSKPPERVVEEFNELSERYNISSFEVTDNILDMSYFKNVLPSFAEDSKKRRIFWETKANLKREHVQLLAKAGVTWIQPGIENLDTRMLKLMDKGVQASHIVQLLKWCREFGVTLSWNFLWGFPDEEDEWFQEMAEWMPFVQHLQPPMGFIRLRYDRYSVYQARSEEYGLKLKPAQFMFLIYPLPFEELMDLTYYFSTSEDTRELDINLKNRSGLPALGQITRDWQKRFWRGIPPILAMKDDDEAIHILDSRDCAVETRTVLKGLDRIVYLACEQAPSENRISAILEKDHNVTANDHEITQVIANLQRRKLLLKIDGRLLSLAVRGSLPTLMNRSEFPGGHVSSALTHTLC